MRIRALAGLAAGALIVALALLPPEVQQALALRPGAVAEGPWWRLWTAHAVHFGLAHAAWDALPLGLLLAGAWVDPGPRCVAVGWLVCAPLVGLAVGVLEPALTEYRGASGAVLWLAVLWGVRAWRRHTVPRGLLGLLAAALLAKLVWDAGGAAVSPALPHGVRVAWSAHLAGALLGGVWGVWAIRTGPDR